MICHTLLWSQANAQRTDFQDFTPFLSDLHRTWNRNFIVLTVSILYWWIWSVHISLGYFSISMWL